VTYFNLLSHRFQKNNCCTYQCSRYLLVESKSSFVCQLISYMPVAENFIHFLSGSGAFWCILGTCFNVSIRRVKVKTESTFPLYKKRTGTAFLCVPVRLEHLSSFSVQFQTELFKILLCVTVLHITQQRYIIYASATVRILTEAFSFWAVFALSLITQYLKLLVGIAPNLQL